MTPIINYLNIHLLQCVHGSECTRMHDAICDALASIAKEVDFNVAKKQLHVLSSSTF